MVDGAQFSPGSTRKPGGPRPMTLGSGPSGSLPAPPTPTSAPSPPTRVLAPRASVGPGIRSRENSADTIINPIPKRPLPTLPASGDITAASANTVTLEQETKAGAVLVTPQASNPSEYSSASLGLNVTSSSPSNARKPLLAPKPGGLNIQTASSGGAISMIQNSARKAHNEYGSPANGDQSGVANGTSSVLQSPHATSPKITKSFSDQLIQSPSSEITNSKKRGNQIDNEDSRQQDPHTTIHRDSFSGSSGARSSTSSNSGSHLGSLAPVTSNLVLKESTFASNNGAGNRSSGSSSPVHMSLSAVVASPSSSNQTASQVSPSPLNTASTVASIGSISLSSSTAATVTSGIASVTPSVAVAPLPPVVPLAPVTSLGQKIRRDSLGIHLSTHAAEMALPPAKSAPSKSNLGSGSISIQRGASDSNLKETSVSIGSSSPSSSISHSLTSAQATLSTEVLISDSVSVSTSVESATTVAKSEKSFKGRFARAMYDYNPIYPDDLFLVAGQEIRVLNDSDSQWYHGLDPATEATGYFPAAYIVFEPDPAGDGADSTDSAVSDSASKAKVDIRGKVMDEIVSTEKDYVSDLRVVIEGYKKHMEKLAFVTKAEITEVFSNIEDIYSFQVEFAKVLEDHHAEGRGLASVFTSKKDGFKIYVEYCKNHPKASAVLTEYRKNKAIQAFFEAARLLIEQDISIEGFLLTPIQRLCKYPLLLKELLKHTPEDHGERQQLEQAFEAMKAAAGYVNEMQRQEENVKIVAATQEKIESWPAGEPTLVDIGCTELLTDVPVVKISKGKAQDRRFFLFDRCLVYVRSTLKKGIFQFKGMVPLDSCRLVNLQDGEQSFSGKPLNNAWSINRYDLGGVKSYVVYAHNPKDKDKFLIAFDRAQEKVMEDSKDDKVRSMIFRRTNSDAKALMRALGDEKSVRSGSGSGSNLERKVTGSGSSPSLDRKATKKQVFKRQQSQSSSQEEIPTPNPTTTAPITPITPIATYGAVMKEFAVKKISNQSQSDAQRS